MVLAHTIVDAPKYGASSRAAAISAPSEAAPVTKTRSLSRKPAPPRGPAGLVLVGGEVGLAGAADGAEPVTGDVLERGSGRDAAIRVPVGGVVDEAAGLTDPLLR